jgi:hypothetical protein
VAVWNLSTVQSSPEAGAFPTCPLAAPAVSDLRNLVGATQIDAYLIFTGALGLLLIFPMSVISCSLAFHQGLVLSCSEQYIL